METIMQVLSDTRFYWLPVAAVIAVIAFVRTLRDIWKQIRTDLE